MSQHTRLAQRAFEHGILDFDDLPNPDRREFIAAWVAENGDARLLADSPIFDLVKRGYIDESADPRELFETIGRKVCDRIANLAIRSFHALAEIHIKHGQKGEWR